LTAALASAADPDTTNTLAVDLTQSGGQLLSGTAADADGDRTLCLVDSELISYQTATLVSANKYNLTTRLRRGQLGSTIAAHSIGGTFLRLDDAVFKYTFDPLIIGQTLYFKFTSFNTAENMEQPLSSATAYSIAVSGTWKGAVDQSSTGGGLDAVFDGSTYARHVASDMTSNRIDFSKGLLNKNLDNVPDGTRAAWSTITQKNAAVDASGNLLLKNVNDVVGTTAGPSCSSISFIVVPEMTQTLTFKGNKVLLLFSSTINIPAVAGSVVFAFFKDGVQLSQSYPVTYFTGNASAAPVVAVEFSLIDSPSAGSHTYDVRWEIVANGCSANGTSRRFQIVELG
jgi:hypothetical protein